MATSPDGDPMKWARLMWAGTVRLLSFQPGGDRHRLKQASLQPGVVWARGHDPGHRFALQPPGPPVKLALEGRCAFNSW
jgi:hypothetical protein